MHLSKPLFKQSKTNKMKVQDLKTIQDVQKFFEHIVFDLGINFHIDTPFSDYVNYSDNEAMMSKSEAIRYEVMMSKAIDICNAEGVDEYELGLDILQSFINS
jgi:hypothetical protein